MHRVAFGTVSPSVSTIIFAGASPHVFGSAPLRFWLGIAERLAGHRRERVAELRREAVQAGEGDTASHIRRELHRVGHLEVIVPRIRLLFGALAHWPLPLASGESMEKTRPLPLASGESKETTRPLLVASGESKEKTRLLLLASGELVLIRKLGNL